MPCWCVSISPTPAFLLAVLWVTPQATTTEKLEGCWYVPQHPLWSWSFTVLTRSPPRVGVQLRVTPSCPCARPRAEGSCGDLPVPCPARGRVRMGNVPGRGSRGRLGEFSRSGRASPVPARCEPWRPGLPKRSPASCLNPVQQGQSQGPKWPLF